MLAGKQKVEKVKTSEQKVTVLHYFFYSKKTFPFDFSCLGLLLVFKAKFNEFS